MCIHYNKYYGAPFVSKLNVKSSNLNSNILSDGGNISHP